MPTSGELPAITLAFPAVQDDGQRWTRWGAAEHGAKEGMGSLPFALLFLGAALLLALTLLFPQAIVIAELALITLVYVLAGGQKVASLIRGVRAVPLPVTADPPDPLPFYSVLVPLHHEQTILPVLVKRLTALDYLVDRLEILLLVEEDDHDTQIALSNLDLPGQFHIVVVPPGTPTTKPRALNVGLAHAHGVYCVVYDAEDRPEPDQLKKAAARFAQADSKLVCLQARLAIYNTDQSWLTRLFSLDYLIWFHALLPGLDLIPLGGTSNHFRTRTVRRLGGWDPYNVTEDADLGLRIARAGLSIGLLDSTTWEEAVPTTHAWLRQRSRWVKGYLQTYLVHMRQPAKTLKDLGIGRFLTFQGAIGASMLTLLVNPLMWALTITYIIDKGAPAGAAIEALFPTPIYFGALLCLVVGNFLYVYLLVYTAVRFGMERLAYYALLGPLYWILMSVGAWMGLVDLILRPQRWALTQHGVSQEAISA
jgi:cellulose synthase/poly-beta-1,6-N-acetylglucosamine synthase-like glycosyltransferase